MNDHSFFGCFISPGRILSMISLLGLILIADCSQAQLVPDPPKQCFNCEAWNEPQAPFQIFANSYYVGTTGLASILITSDEGHILLDGGLSQSAPLIAASIEKIGYKLSDVSLILNSHAHYDHAGGIAALLRASGARMAASPGTVLALAHGGPLPDDPQFGFGALANGFPQIDGIEVIANGQTLHLGELRITAHFTPGHAAGSTSWSWASCDEHQCLDLVYADSINPVSAPGFRFSDSRSEWINFARIRQSNETLAQLPCDILLSPHPFYFDMGKKLTQMSESASFNPFIDTDGCKEYAADGIARLTKRVEEERETRLH